MEETFVYLAFYKPYGVLTAFTDEEGRDTLKAYIDVPGVYPAGRLDMDSEGLLLLTNDGNLAHRLTDPQFNHPKTYLVQVEGTPTPEALGRLEGGVEVKGEKTRRSQVIISPEPDLPPRSRPVTPHGPTAWLRIVLREGKKRQIRHMTAAVGLPTLRLVRIAIGPITLDQLQPGEWRYLTPAEVDGLKQYVQTSSQKTSSATLLASKRPVRPWARAVGKPAKSPGSNRGSRYRSGGRRSQGR
jgi:23S rRNA pseudouridine2457 synthase